MCYPGILSLPLTSYKSLCRFNNMEANSFWSNVWRIHAPERVRYFIWLVCHGRLFIDLKKSRNQLGDSCCNFCGNEIESILHVLRECLLARAI